METIVLDLGAAYKGNSQLDGFKDKILIDSFSFGVSLNTYTRSDNKERTSGNPNFTDFQFMKAGDASTPLLFQACAAAENLPDATLTFVRNDQGKMLPQMVIKLIEPIVTSMNSQAGGGGFSESFSINVTKYEMTYHVQKTDSGQEGTVATNWDMKLNKKA